MRERYPLAFFGNQDVFLLDPGIGPNVREYSIRESLDRSHRGNLIGDEFPLQAVSGGDQIQGLIPVSPQAYVGP